MIILVVGLGSMGKRRIRILQEKFSQHKVFGLDSRSDRCNDIESLYGIKTLNNLEEALTTINPDAVFVCTSPLSHSKIVKEALKHGCHTFSEINLVNDGYHEIIQLAKSKNKTAFLSSTFLYRKEISWIKEIVMLSKKKCSYQYHVGQYLPDWHPWENYQDFFVKDKKTNGCREILAIELPWILNCFGKIRTVKTITNKISSLDIDYDDVFHILLEHENGSTGTFTVDVVSRHPIRSFELFSEDNHIFWNGSPDSLKQYSIEDKSMESIELDYEIEKDESYAATIIENPYVEEVKYFLELIERGKENLIYTYKDDLIVIDLIEEIENVREI